MTLSAFAWNIVRTYTLTPETLLLRLPVPAGHGLQLGDVRQRGRQRLRGRHRHLPRHALAGCLEHGAPGLLGAAGRNREAALRSLRRVYPRAGAAVGGHAGPVQHADQGQRLRGRVCLSNGPAGGLAGPHGLGPLDGLTAQGNVGCDQLLCNDVNCTDVFTTGVDASGAVSCAALTATGAVAGATLTSTGAVSGSLGRSDGGELRSHRCAHGHLGMTDPPLWHEAIGPSLNPECSTNSWAHHLKHKRVSSCEHQCKVDNPSLPESDKPSRGSHHKLLLGEKRF